MKEQLTHARREAASRYSDTIDRTRLFGVRPRCASGAPVIGDVFLPVLSQASMDDRSYVLPSAAMTGCCINSIEIGQHRLSGWSPPEVAAVGPPLAADAEAAAMILLASSAGTPTPHKSSTVGRWRC